MSLARLICVSKCKPLLLWVLRVYAKDDFLPVFRCAHKVHRLRHNGINYPVLTSRNFADEMADRLRYFIAPYVLKTECIYRFNRQYLVP